MGKEERIIRQLKGHLTPIASEMILPNLSGDHSAGIVKETPTDNLDIPNKKYVDDAIATIPLNHDHATLTNLNSANYTHLTATNATDLTDGGSTTLHTHPSSSVKTTTGRYAYAMADVAGLASANVFFVLSNPVGSGKYVKLKKMNIMGYGIAIGITKIGLRCSRAYASVTGGTLVNPSTVAKIDSTYPLPTAEIRTGNPTVYQIADFKSRGPGGTITVANLCGGFGTEIDFNPRDSISEIYLYPGQALSIYQSGTGDVDNTYNLNLTWEEEE